jgi:hypothetical protein
MPAFSESLEATDEEISIGDDSFQPAPVRYE